MHIEVDIYFTTSIAVEELKLGLSTEALHPKVEVAVDVGES